MLHSLKAVQNMGRLLLVKFIVAFGRMIIVRRNLSEKDKKEIGTCCYNYGSIQELEYHHIISICLGGNDTNSNMSCLCYQCHPKMHFVNAWKIFQAWRIVCTFICVEKIIIENM